MAFIEIVFARLKNDPKLLKDAGNAMPLAFKAFRAAGALRTSQGTVVSENGQPWSDPSKVFVLEWPSEPAFHGLFTSAEYAAFGGAFKPSAGGPPNIVLYETNAGIEKWGSRSVLEVLQLSPKNKADGVEGILGKVKAILTKNNDSEAIYGSSLNVPEKKAVVVRIFSDKQEVESEKNASTRKEIIAQIGDVADVTQSIVDLEHIELAKF
ncbi:hypothetical protein M426DRAFT_317776 [Hypoxylon sp. CI-4A]|nr:hypothetical protein M426DRAFT_317776 [Hypoxylon sp. CI-4A]